MNFTECTPSPVSRFGGIVQWDDPTLLPIGLATVARNLRWTPQGVGTRWGFSNRLTFGVQGSKVAALGMVRYLALDNSGAEVIKLAGYTQTDGNVWSATPFLQSSVAQMTNDTFIANTNLTRVPGLYPVISQAFNKGMIARGNLTTGVAEPLVFDPNAGTLDQLSDKPFGVPWSPGESFRVGQMVSPSTFETYGLPVEQGIWVAATTGHLYRCTQNGITGGTQPVWPVALGSTIGDGTVQWQETTPRALSGLPDPLAPITPTTAADSTSPIAAGSTVFLASTYVNAGGEGINELATPDGVLDPSKVLKYTNTTGAAVDLSVVLPAIPANVGTGGPLGTLGATQYQLYAYITADLAPDIAKYTDPTYYAQVAGGPFNPGSSVTISGYPAGVTLPVVNTADVAGDGNVDTGVRFMVVLYETRTEYETGWGASSPIRVNVTDDGHKLRADTIPIGPYNCISRICAFTVGGAGKAGPYFYVDQDDVESPGFDEADIPITATRINNNVDTSAEFNFTDTYLPGASEVTDYVNRIEVPAASHIGFIRNGGGRVVYTGCKGFPSGFLISDDTDGEAVRVPGSNLQVSESDGDRTVGICEVRDNPIALKENSGFAIIPNDGDPNTWDPQVIWRGSGPAGAKAFDVGTEDASEFLVYAHKTGPYLYQGQTPRLIGREIGASMNTRLNGFWKRINWAFGYKIVVRVDNSRREVRFSAPLDTATENSHTFTLSYALGWDDPVVFSPRQGKEIPNLNGRRWSIDDVPALDWVYVPQRYQVNASQDGVDLNDAMIMGGADGAVYTLTEGQFFDHDYALAKLGYFADWLSVPMANQNLNTYSLHGATISALGSGILNVYAVDDRGKRFYLSTERRVMTLTPLEQQRDFGLVAATSSRYGLGFNNGGVPGAGFDVHQGILWVKRDRAQRVG